jgi:shikimate dehydrogenase
MDRIAIIGQPLAHSISPGVIEAAFSSAGIEARCELWDVSPDALEMHASRLRDADVLGALITAPHKEAIIPLLDSVDETAQEIGAVNVIAKDGDKLAGYNTDASGFMRALREDAGVDPKQKYVGVLGAGGAARAVSYSLVQAGASIVMLAGHTPKQLEGIVKENRPRTRPGVTISWTHWMDGVFMQELPKVDVLINCTPVGTKGTESEGTSPIDAEFLPARGLVFDLVYNPPETQLLKDAKSKGARTVSGLSMLLYQAADAFRLWTKKDADLAAMRSAAEAALR